MNNNFKTATTMKKNINVNFFGTLYAIDEDACKLLESYLANMKSYFAKREGGDEIADDIEHRVAEHLWELKQNGLDAIDINTVKQLIESIGDPSQMDCGGADDDTAGAEAQSAADDGADGTAEGTTAAESAVAGGSDGAASGSRWQRIKHHMASHRFYRDGKDKIGGGVISGLCHYCGGGDTLVWRIGAVLLVVLSFMLGNIFDVWMLRSLFRSVAWLTVLLYAVVWLLAPVARTAEERLYMTGAKVTPQSISQAVIAEVDEEAGGGCTRSKGNGCLGRLVDLLGFCLKCVLLLSFSWLLAVAVALFVGMVSFAMGSAFVLSMIGLDSDVTGVLNAIPSFGFYGICSALCLLVAALLPFIMVLRMFAPGRKHMSAGSIAALVGVWVVALSLGIALLSMLGASFRNERRVMVKKECTRNGVYFDSHTWDCLDSRGWVVDTAINVGPSMYSYGGDDPLRGSERVFDITPDKKSMPFGLKIHRRSSEPEGKYVLECMSSCNIPDALLSVWSGGHCLTAIRLDGYKAAADMPLRTISWSDSRSVPMLCEQTDSTVWVDGVMRSDTDWHYLKSPSFAHKGGTVEYRLQIGDGKQGSTSADGRLLLSRIRLRQL